MDAKKVGSALNTIAHGQAMMAAIRDYKKEMLNDAAARGSDEGGAQVDVSELLDDPELQRLHAERIQAMQAEAELRAVLSRRGHGSLQEIQEGDFLEVVTQTRMVVVHFFHAEFERCRIMDMHLGRLTQKYFDTRFVKISAPSAPFFVAKLGVRTLPCVVAFLDGVSVARWVGFDQLGGRDDFSTARLEAALLAAGVVQPPKRAEGDESDEDEEAGGAFAPRTFQKGSDDEDSDFD